MKQIHAVAPVLVCSYLTVLAGCTRDLASTCATGEGAPVVANVGPGEWSRAGIEPVLVEVWRSANSVGQPSAVTADRSGRLAVADWELGEVHVYSADGASIGPWPIDAPIETPVALSWDPQGGLHIFDLVASAYLRTDSTGALVERRPTSTRALEIARELGGMKWAGLAPDGTIYFQPLHELDPESQDVGASISMIWRLRPNVPTVDTVTKAPVRLLGYTLSGHQAAPTWPYLRAATGGNGILAIGGRDDRYRIDLFDTAGQHIRTICREADPLPLTAEERGEVEKEVYAEALREVPQPGRPAVHAGFFLGAEGRLWVQRDRPSALNGDKHTATLGNPGGLYDVFDAAGRYMGEVRAPASVRLLAAAGQAVWGLAETGLDGARIVAYQLQAQP